MVRATSAPNTFETVGTLRSAEAIMLRPEVAGRVRDIHFADGVTRAQQDAAAQIVAEYDARAAAREADQVTRPTPEEVDAATTVAQLRQIVKRLVEGV